MYASVAISFGLFEAASCNIFVFNTRLLAVIFPGLSSEVTLTRVPVKLDKISPTGFLQRHCCYSSY